MKVQFTKRNQSTWGKPKFLVTLNLVPENAEEGMAIGLLATDLRTFDIWCVIHTDSLEVQLVSPQVIKRGKE